jgi:hypothetical protein
MLGHLNEHVADHPGNDAPGRADLGVELLAQASRQIPHGRAAVEHV